MDSPTVDVTVRDNQVIFSCDQQVGFNYDGASSFVITNGQPFDGVTVNCSGNTLTIDVQAGRQAVEWVADRFNAICSGMCVGLSAPGVGSPDKLNFFFSGTLYVGDISCSILIGQGHNINNNWWVGANGDTSSWNRSTYALSYVPNGNTLLEFSQCGKLPYNFGVSSTVSEIK